MKDTKLTTAIDLIKFSIVFFALYLPMSSGMYLMTHSMKDVYWMLLFLPVTYLSYLIRIHCDHIFTFWAFHVGMLGIVALIFSSSQIQRFFAAGYLLLLTIYQFSMRLKEQPKFPSNVSAALILPVLAASLFNQHMDLYVLNRQMTIVVILCCLLYLINLYLCNFIQYFLETEAKPDIPMAQILISQRRLLAGFLSCCTILLVILSRFSYDGILSALGNLLLTFARFLLSPLANQSKEPAVPPAEPQSNGQMPLLLDAPNEPGPLLKLIEKLLTYGIWAAIVLGLLALIFWSLYQWYKKFHSIAKIQGTDQIEFVSPFEDLTKGIPQASSPKKSLSRFFLFQTPTEKIRLHFKKEIMTHTDSKQLSLSYYTSKELTALCDRDIDSDAESVKKELRQLYDKARYSKESCTKEDLQKMKHLHL